MIKLTRVLLPVPSCIFQSFMAKSTPNSDGFKIKVKKTSRKKKYMQNAMINTELFGPVLNSTASRKCKIKKLEKIVKNPNQDANISHVSLTSLNYENPVLLNDEIGKIEHNLNNSSVESLVANNETTQISLSDNENLNNFPLFNKNRYSIQYPLTNKIFNINYNSEYTELPSVSKVLQATMPPERKIILQKWEENMIQKLGEEGFRKYKQDMFDRGKLFHSYVEQSLRKEIQGDFARADQYIKSVNGVLEDIDNVKLLESRVIHPQLQYYGYVDCVGLFRGKPVVIDFKTSAKLKPTLNSTYDSPLQVVAYLGAINYDQSYNEMPNIPGAILVIAYETGIPAHIHQISKEKCFEYWELWCKRLLQFRNMNTLT